MGCGRGWGGVGVNIPNKDSAAGGKRTGQTVEEIICFALQWRKLQTPLALLGFLLESEQNSGYYDQRLVL